jgi:hypothetical protein
MYENQERLPRLPIPPLQKTVEKYVRTLVPYVSKIAADGTAVVEDEEALGRLQSEASDFVVKGTTYDVSYLLLLLFC